MSPLLPQVTPNSAAQRLQNDGLLALGLTAPLLSPSWSSGDPLYDSAKLTLTISPMTAASGGDVRPPFRGIRTWVADLTRSGLSPISGQPGDLTGPGAVLRMHPQAASRLERLVAGHLTPGSAAIHPVPHTVLVRCQQNPKTTVQAFGPGVALDVNAGDISTMTFHDERGLIIDPVAVAALFVELVTAYPALAPLGIGNSQVGDVTMIAKKSLGGILVHVVDPHGAPFVASTSGVAPSELNANNQPVGPPLSGLRELAANSTIGVDPTTPLRLGWARNSTLGRTALAPPALPVGVALTRRFLRVCAVNLDWHLLGNRSAATIGGIGPSDDSTTIPVAFRPVVRDRTKLTYLVDGPDVLASAAQTLAPATQPGTSWTGHAFAVSPVLDANVGVPPPPPASAHWPAFPAPIGGVGAPVAPILAGLTARWVGGHDVVLTFPSAIPQSHVRVYPQQFQLITSIDESPSFLRADGGAGVVPGVVAGQPAPPFSILLIDPLRLAKNQTQPTSQLLIFDLVVTDRAAVTQMIANASVPIGPAGGGPLPADQFDMPDALVGPAGVLRRAISPSPVFGLPAAPPPNPAPTTFIDIVRSLAGEGNPRTSPRLPTMARFPTLVVLGTTGPKIAWNAVVSGGRWSRETRSADHARGNPGNPAGPDVHAAGISVDGAAAFDVARIALRRSVSLMPLAAQGSLGWLPIVAGSDWVPPPEPATETSTSAAAVLHTVALGCESPELALVGASIPDPPASIVQTAVDTVAAFLQITPPPTVTVNARVEQEVRHELFANRFGHRDAQWSLRRAFGQARDLVFVCSPQFAATAYPDAPLSPQPHEVDLVTELAARMQAQPSLLALICLPRWPDFHPLYGAWMQHAFAARNQARLTFENNEVDLARVVAFHPAGFPGRHVAVRSTVVIVDDVFALVGTSHLRRRGMTFDEGVDVASFDRALDATGTSTSIRTYRQALLASLTGVRQPAANRTDADWSRLAGTRSCVDFVADLLRQGGLGRLSPFWPGPTTQDDTQVLAQKTALVDPDGASKADLTLKFAGLIGESPGT